MSCLGPWFSHSQGLCWYTRCLLLSKVVWMPRMWAVTWDHVAVQDHTFAGPMPIKEACIITTQGNDDIRVQAAAAGHFWVPGPAATVVCVDICYHSSHTNHEWKYMLNHVLKYKSHASLPLTGSGWAIPPPCLHPITRSPERKHLTDPWIADPNGPCTWEIWPHPALWAWVVWLHPSPHWKEWSQWPRLTNSSTTQSHIRDFELAFPNIAPIYHLLECARGLAL